MTADRLTPPTAADNGLLPHPDRAWPEQERVIVGVLNGAALQLVLRDADAVAAGRAMLDRIAEALGAASAATAAPVRSVRIDGADRPTFDDVLGRIGDGSAAREGGTAAVVRRAAVRAVLADRQAGRKTVLLADNADGMDDATLRELYQFVSAFGEGGLQLVLVAAPSFRERIAAGGLLAQLGVAARVLALSPALPATLLGGGGGGRQSPDRPLRQDVAGGGGMPLRDDRLEEIIAGLRHAAADTVSDAASPAIGSDGRVGIGPSPLEAGEFPPHIPEPAFKPLKHAAAEKPAETTAPAAMHRSPVDMTPATSKGERAAAAAAAIAAIAERAGKEREPLAAAQQQQERSSRGLGRLLRRTAVGTVLAAGLTVATIGSGVLRDDYEGGGGGASASASPPPSSAAVEPSGEGTSRADAATNGSAAMSSAPSQDRQSGVARESAGGASIVPVIDAAASPNTPEPPAREESPVRRDPPAADAGPASPPPAAAKPANGIAAVLAAAAAPPDDPAPPESAQALIGHGEECFAHGDVAGARLFFQRAARSGSAQGMTALARTYDVSFLKRIGMRPSLGDESKATALYRQAAAAGDADAKRRLEPSPED